MTRFSSGFPAVQPVLHVVRMKEGRVGAPGEGTAAVTQHQRPADGRRNGAGAAADVQCLPVSACGDQAAIAGHPPERFRGNARAILEGGGPGVICTKHLLVEVNHHLEALPSGSRHGIAGQVRLCKFHGAVRP